MTYRGVVKRNAVVLEEGILLPEGIQVEVVPLTEFPQGSPAALLQVWGSDLPDEAWAEVEKAIEELDAADRESSREQHV